jgi:hypothetical protein
MLKQWYPAYQERIHHVIDQFFLKRYSGVSVIEKEFESAM